MTIRRYVCVESPLDLAHLESVMPAGSVASIHTPLGGTVVDIDTTAPDDLDEVMDSLGYLFFPPSPPTIGIATAALFAQGGPVAGMTGGPRPLPVSYILGYVCNPAGVGFEAVDVTIGACRDDSDVWNILTGGGLTANINLTGIGGRNIDSAAATQTWYAVMVVASTTGAGPIGIMLINQFDLGTFTFPAGYDVKRRVGWAFNTESGFVPYRAYEVGHSRRIKYSVNPRADLDVFGTLEETTFTTASVADYAPPTCNLVELDFQLDAGSDDYIELRPTGSGLANDTGRRVEPGVSSGIKIATLMLDVTDDQEFDWRKNDLTGPGLTVYCYGYIDDLETTVIP